MILDTVVHPVTYKSVLLVKIHWMDMVMNLVVIAQGEVCVTIVLVLALVSQASLALDANIKRL